MSTPVVTPEPGIVSSEGSTPTPSRETSERLNTTGARSRHSRHTWRIRFITVQGYLAALAGVTLVSLVIAFIRLAAHIENISLLYLLVVLGLAVAYGRGPAILASVLAFLAYDFFFIPPLYLLTVSDPTEWLSLLALLATSLVAGQLTAAVRARAREARESEQRTATLYALAQLISKTTDEKALLPALAERVVEVFRPLGAEACAILLPEPEGARREESSDRPTTLAVRALAPAETPFADTLRLSERRDAARAIWAYEHGVMTGGAIQPDNLRRAEGRQTQNGSPGRGGNVASVVFFTPLHSGTQVPGVLAVAGGSALWRLMVGERADHSVRTPLRAGIKVTLRRRWRRRWPDVFGMALRRWQALDTEASDNTLAQARALFAGFCDQIALAVERQLLAREAIHVAALRESDRMKNALLGTVTHDLRTPLASIRAATDSLMEPDVTWDDEQRRYFLETIHTSELRLSHMVSNLLDLSRLEAGVAIPQKQWYPIGDVIATTLDRLDLIGLTAGRTIDLDIPADLPLVPLDHEQIEQVVTNLIENAVKYSPAGKPIGVQARVVAPTQPNETGELEARISDHGEGIPANELKTIFDKFYRVQQGKRGSKKTQPGGAGLGLAICAAIIQAHGGRIWAESEVGVGSTFIFRLPIPRDEEPHTLPEAGEPDEGE